MAVGAGEVQDAGCMAGGSNNGALSVTVAARDVIGLALALVTGVAPVALPLLVAFALASLVASFTSWNFSIN